MPNRLRHSLSPYLLQHADNPVDWWQWGPDALAEARRRDVPLLISVGYAACHWCHVMAHESFEDSEVAAAINAHTVPIKVDREERPDIDSVYMQATVAMTGQGGWPMTVFAAPDGTPFHAGTYYPREQLLRLLAAVDEAWTHRRAEVLAQGNAIVDACSTGGPALTDVTRVCPVGGPCPPVAPVDSRKLDAAAAALLRDIDPVNGGFRGAPKFPTQPALQFLLAQHHRTGDGATLTAVARTGERMARGGIHDQLAGGFARYSVDATWTVPHFEKMLYDNALLLSTYLDLFEATGREYFGGVADGIARFLIEDLGTPEGGFAAALDADTGGVEGATYVWTPQQLSEVLGESDGNWAAEVFGVSPAGTFEAGSSVLRLPEDPLDAGLFSSVKKRLLAARRERPQPLQDDKVVACWNGLTIVALTRYATVRGSDLADAAAERAAELLRDVHLADGRVARVSRHGRVGTAAGILEDQAAVAGAFLARSRSAGGAGEHWAAAARSVVDAMLAHFVDEAGRFQDTADDAEILAYARTDVTDGPTPSGTALAADVLLAFAAATGDAGFDDQLWRTLAGASEIISEHPRFAAGLAAVAERAAR
ncbi:thioredoxin domain-containing protein [Nakamurella lactea]|uniref:thioredoxin domain-containing protein n=1 Tax=Nakamurella lactea TaxID=459515 RepID=UPI0004202D1E|nr:thioredoxin domain-containing protein [Nakamurella lactea]